jgi:flagellin-like hook-associated protein FlgL
LTMRARIRGIDEPEEARKFARVEAEHQARQSVVARANQRAEELQG